MTPQLLASISTDRHITHRAGQTVFINWDNRRFSLPRARFVRLVRALEHGAHWLYAENEAFSVVHVDDDRCEVWIENSCLTLDRREYRALLNAALRTETRLHGYRVVNELEPTHRLTVYRKPTLARLHWN